MAKIIPNFDKILKMKVPPTEGELHLLHTLDSTLDDNFEVFFNPYLNGDRPDVVVFHATRGVLFIEVKDWDLSLYELNDKKQWKLKYPKNTKEAEAVLKSPISQVLKYKENLFDLHIEHLLELKIKDIRNFNFVSCAVYFHNASESQISDLLVAPYDNDKKYQTFLKWNISLISRNNLVDNLRNCMHNYWLDRDSKFALFTKNISDNIRRFLLPTIHIKEDGEYITYDERQNSIVYSPRTEMRIKGVMGSGKTTILAKRAAVLASQNSDNRILILSYNITLKNYIHDKINSVQEKFSWGQFTINNYHEFINSQLNNLGIDIVIPEDTVDISGYLERNYYGNTSLFEEHSNITERYDAIFIDEIQDYHRSWMDIIKNFFKKENGQYLLFGDVKQNIYSNSTNGKDVVTNIIGKPIELIKCYRSQFKIRELAVDFQKEIFKDKYELDTFDKQTKDAGLTLDFDYNLEGYINYMYLDDTNTVTSLYNIIRGNMLNKEKNIHPNDITILGYKLSTLQKFEAYYRYKSHEKTTTMFETFETMFLQNLNYFSKENEPAWYTLLLNKYSTGEVKSFDGKKKNIKISLVLTAYHLYQNYPEIFDSLLESKCSDIHCTVSDFKTIIELHQDEYNSFTQQVFQGDYDCIRKNKKLHFWMNTGNIKVSTIHSFKGWESQVVFLILENKNDYSTSFDELLYTGITRSKSDIVIVNYGNKDYDERMKKLINKVK